MIRLAVLFFCLLLFLLKRKRRRKKEFYAEEYITKMYTKNEQGLYPWEADQNDSPERIDEKAKRYTNPAKVKRGRW